MYVLHSCIYCVVAKSNEMTLSNTDTSNFIINAFIHHENSDYELYINQQFIK